MEEHICEYGCGQHASFLMKNGKWCCSKSVNSCPAMRKKNSIGCSRFSSCHTKKSSYGMRGKTPWNKGLTKETSLKVSLIAEKLQVSNKGKSHPQNKSTREKISRSMKKRGCGGIRKGSGRGKKGWYKGYWCDSTWELAFVVYSLEHDVKIYRNTEYFLYESGNRVRKYYPDFKYEDGTYVEIKGYYTKQFECKVRSFPKDKSLVIYDKNTIGKFLMYTEEKYGKDFYRLYEGS